MSRPPTEITTTLAEALDSLLHFGAAMLRAGDTAFRVREWTSVIARATGLDALSMQVALGSIAATARRGGEGATLVREVASPGINTWRLVDGIWPAWGPAGDEILCNSARVALQRGHRDSGGCPTGIAEVQPRINDGGWKSASRK
jgi:hypothetical protein